MRFPKALSEHELWNADIVNRAECWRFNDPAMRTLSVKALFTSPRYEAMEIEFQYNETARPYYLVPSIYTQGFSLLYGKINIISGSFPGNLNI